jgi:SAM-dependent methyltransferase
MTTSEMLRRLFTPPSSDPVAFWRGRASAPGLQSVMWSNHAYNACADRDHAAAIARHLPARRGAVLDLGCGTGRFTPTLSALFHRYVGVDLDTMVAEARRCNPPANAEFVACPVQQYEFPENQFDLVLSMACLASACTAEELPAIAARIVAATRAGGRIVLIDPFHRTPVLVRTCRLNAAEVVRIFTALGVTVIGRTAMHFIPCRLLLASRSAPESDRFTRTAYAIGERVRLIAPRLSGDYHVMVFEKPGGPAGLAINGSNGAATGNTNRSR